MPLSNPTVDYDAQSGSITTSDTIAVTMTAGRVYVMMVGVAVTGKTVTSVTDNLGNTWQTPVTKSDTSIAASTIACACTVGGSATITINYANATAAAPSYLVASSSQLTSAVADKTSSNSAPINTTSISETTATLSQADEIVFSFVVTSGSMSTFTQPSGFTALGTGASYCKYSYQVVTATTAVTGGGSWVTSRHVASITATYAGTIAAVGKAPAYSGARRNFAAHITRFSEYRPNWRPRPSGLLIPEYA